jgi:hypothetical protein
LLAELGQSGLRLGLPTLDVTQLSPVAPREQQDHDQNQGLEETHAAQ